MRDINRSPVTPLKPSLSSVCHLQSDSANHTHKLHFSVRAVCLPVGGGCTHIPTQAYTNRQTQTQEVIAVSLFSVLPKDLSVKKKTTTLGLDRGHNGIRFDKARKKERGDFLTTVLSKHSSVVFLLTYTALCCLNRS